MTRRSTHKLQKLHVQRLMRPISASDGFGWIYAYVDWGSEWKIGMTSDFDMVSTDSGREPTQSGVRSSHFAGT
ncbi:hypothetical protein F5051DRAFT_444589 [Lentinula edodes]|nr:hypothetical protein F5051DRAFT_444589 [Lentinula edodes]